MATHHGAPWLEQQVESVLNQVGVDVHIFVSDDLSTDSTVAWITNKAIQDKRISLLPLGDKFGSAGKNFFRLIKDIDLLGYDYVAFCDQDDIWECDKLVRHIMLAKAQHADGVSSNVLAFWPNNKKKLIVKSQVQRKWDFLFESAGPGCTFLMTPWLVSQLKSLLKMESGFAKDATLHDWLAYAVCRSSGHKWVIDAHPSVLYRQHESNVLGANSGLKAKLSRIVKLKQGWYRSEIKNMCKISLMISQNEEINQLLKLLESNTFISQIKLLCYVPQARRKFSDRVFLLLSILLFWFSDSP
jgi:rhamnosyltransferase